MPLVLRFTNFLSRTLFSWIFHIDFIWRFICLELTAFLVFVFFVLIIPVLALLKIKFLFSGVEDKKLLMLDVLQEEYERVSLKYLIHIASWASINDFLIIKAILLNLGIKLSLFEIFIFLFKLIIDVTVFLNFLDMYASHL